jgi:hypothetical protein
MAVAQQELPQLRMASDDDDVESKAGSSVPPRDGRPVDGLPIRLPFLSRGTGAKIFGFLQGPRPPREVTLRSWRRQVAIETGILRATRPVFRFRWLLTPLFLALWIVGVALLTRESWFSSNDATLLSTGASFWLPNAQCGLDGIDCQPFDNSTLVFRCPANPIIKLLNPRAIGAQNINLKVHGGRSRRLALTP